MGSEEIGTRARRIARGAAFGAYASGILGALELHTLRTSEAELPALHRRYKHRIATDLLRILGVRRFLRGEAPRAQRARLVVSNHRAALDVGVLMSIFGGSFLSRADLADWPVLGRLSRHGGTIFVDRDDRSSGAKAIRAIRRRLQSDGTVCVFPEGTTHAGDQVRAFSPGTLVAMSRLEVEVVPVGLAYDPGVEFVQPTFTGHLANLAARPRTHVAAVVGEARVVTAKPRELAQSLQREVQALVHDARALLDTRRPRSHASESGYFQ